MTERIHLQNLLRLTLTRKGKAIAKHPLLRTGVIEAIKAEQSSAKGQSVDDDDPLWEEPESEDADADWYGDFAAHIATLSGEDIPEDWVVSFDNTTEKADGKKKNYPSSRGPFAGPHNSFPIKTQQDVYDAARLVGHAANPAAVKQHIIRIAHSKGFSLPKSWAAKKAQAMDETQFEELVKKLQERLAGVAPAAPEAPAKQETEKAEAPTEAEKAKSMSHSHEHNHSTQRGYGYSHTHDHTHGSMEDHETSESAHGHDHVSKAEEAGEADVEALKADVAGLDGELKVAKEQLVALTAELETTKATLVAKAEELSAKTKVAEEVEAIKAELAKAVESARQPLIADAPKTAEKAKPDVKSMSFDDALTAILHS